MRKSILHITIGVNDTLLYALKYMDKIDRKLLLVADNEKYAGLISIGDIQRAIIRNHDLNTPVGSVLRDDYTLAGPDDSLEEIKSMMLKYRTEFMPVIDETGQLVNVYFWEDIFTDNEETISAGFDLPVVIMAGGLGSRLKPLTNVLPKPLIPINEKTMLEEIFDRFSQYGSKRFYISLNYKADLIKYYIDKLNLKLDISYFEECKPLGTAGSLSLIKDRIKETFFITNCDILINDDYSEILRFHKEKENEITVIAAVKNFPIAYGTIETGINGMLMDLIEKPELTFKINTGMYILEPGVIDEIPENEMYNITDLINKLKKDGRNIGVFPIWQSNWIDIGDWKEYLDVLKQKTY